jgi:hypothetical protein
MTTQIDETKRVLADGEVYTVRVGNRFFSRFDEDSHPWLGNLPHGVTKERAEEIAAKVGDGAKVVVAPNFDREHGDVRHENTVFTGAAPPVMRKVLDG